MDIEGTEYEAMPAIMKEDGMTDLIDELFVEIHYKHPEMANFGWDGFSPHTINDAHTLLQKFRNTGVAVHPWP
jgi:hypothetical protein